MSEGFLRSSGSCADPTGSTVIADVVCSVDDGPAVRVAKVPTAHIVHVRVVAELIVAPVAAVVAAATIAVPIVDAAVEADFRAPIAVIPGIPIIAPTPITGRPEVADCGWLDPSARHPVVALITVGPIAGRPEIAILRARRLRIDDQFRRSDGDRGAELSERCGRHSKYDQQW